jgi:hypothetical protein
MAKTMSWLILATVQASPAWMDNRLSFVNRTIADERNADQGIGIMKWLVPMAVTLGLFAAACATTSGNGDSRCTVRSIDDVERDPLRYSEAVFCGDVYVVTYDRLARVLKNADESPTSSDLTMLVTSSSRGLLRDLSTTPSRFYIRARLRPQEQCFVPSASGEECVPFSRPVFVNVLSAHSRP